MRNAQTPYLMAVTTTTARAPGGTTSGRSDHVIWRPDDGTGGSREPTAQRPIRDLTILWARLTVPGPYTPFHPSREPGTTGIT